MAKNMRHLVSFNLVNSNRAQQVKVPRIRRQKSIFPQKLWRMVNDRQLDVAIRWAEDGQSFVIQENELKIKCLGKENNLFYTKQPKSFVRQLHLYGFRKINKNQFSHNYFVRGQPHLLEHIKRSYKPSLSLDADSDNVENDRNNSQINQMIELNNNDIVAKPSDVLASLQIEQQQTEQQLPVNQVEEYNVELELPGALTLDENLDDSINNLNNQKLLPTAGALVFPCNYDEDCLQPSISWYEGNYVDNNYNYNEDSILTLYNNDIYPNTSDDNNITL